MGNGLWSLSGTTGWSTSTPTNMTLNCQNSTIKFTDNSISGIAFSGGGLTYNNVWFDRPSSGGTIAISGVNNTFNSFKMTTVTAATTLSISQGHNQNFAEFIVNGSPGFPVTINRSGVTAVLFTKTTPGIVSVNYITFAGQSVNSTPDNTWYEGPYSSFLVSAYTYWKLTTPTRRYLGCLGAG